MKRQIQLRGERDWAGDDLIALQSEPLKAIDNLFSGYPSCVISGCVITAVDDRYNISPGLVSLHGQNHADQKTSMVVPFAGATQVVLPAYLTLKYSAVNDIYGDGLNKPIAYDYTASVTNVKPNGDSYIEITSSGCRLFLDVLQDDKHTFVTKEERDNWNSIYGQIREEIEPSLLMLYQAIIDAKYEATDFTLSKVAEAKAYTDTKFTEAKSYSDARLVEAKTYTYLEVAKAKSYSDTKLIEAKAYTDDKTAPLEKINLIIGQVRYNFEVDDTMIVNQFKGNFTVEEIGIIEYTYVRSYRIHHNLNTSRYVVDIYLDTEVSFTFERTICQIAHDNYVDISFLVYDDKQEGNSIVTEFTFKITVF